MKIVIALIGIAFLAASCGGGTGTNPNAPPVLSAIGPFGGGIDPIGQQIVIPRTQRAPGAVEAPFVTVPPEPRGAVTATAVAPPRAVSRWTSYKRFRFDGNTSDLQPSDSGAVSEIAAYLARSPSVRLGIDGTDSRDRGLGGRRVAAIQAALVRAGVASSRIEAGEFGTSRIKRDRSVEVLLISR